MSARAGLATAAVLGIVMWRRGDGAATGLFIELSNVVLLLVVLVNTERSMSGRETRRVA